jgi:FkbM family methyltransferase
LVRASSDLAPAAQPDDRPFRHYSLRNRIISWVSRSLFDSITYTVRHGLLRGMKREGGLGWLPAALAARETQEDRFWRKQDLTGAVIYDVGAFHGLLTMLFARSGREVVSYEPNSRNRRRLEANVKLNRLRNVAIRPVGLGSRRALVTMLTPLGAPGGATIGRLAAEETRRPDRRADYEEVAVTTLDRDIRESGLPAPDLIKIDVEGVELEVLAGARDTLLRYRPQLFIEIHGETMNLKRSNAAAVVEYLRAMGYGQIRHVESGAPINASNAHVAARGHLYCNYGEAGRLTAAVSA